jgi:dolichol-phosphate mannosyltransferase
MVVLLVVSGVQLMIMGILGEYLWRNLDETRRRPRFIVEKVVEGRASAGASKAA